MARSHTGARVSLARKWPAPPPERSGLGIGSKWREFNALAVREQLQRMEPAVGIQCGSFVPRRLSAITSTIQVICLGCQAGKDAALFQPGSGEFAGKGPDNQQPFPEGLFRHIEANDGPRRFINLHPVRRLS